jgi:SAM-dependent methyltransferase
MIAGLKTSLKSRFPSAWNAARTTRQLMRLIPRVYGYEPRTCVMCGRRGKFLAEMHFPDIFVYDAVCPHCASQPRHRLLKLAVEEKGLLSDKPRVLHFAPEGNVRAYVEPQAGLYKTADLFAHGVDLKLNIEAIDQPDGVWDVIICSHVLEHVDHRKALGELHRILAPGGVLLAMFPIVDAWPQDYEAPEVTAPRDRGLHFGKDNHLRRFGASVREEFLKAGFELEAYAPIGPDVVRYGLIPGETLFIARRPAAAARRPAPAGRRPRTATAAGGKASKAPRAARPKS